MERANICWYIPCRFAEPACAKKVKDINPKEAIKRILK
jgi:hypothetical protein